MIVILVNNYVAKQEKQKREKKTFLEEFEEKPSYTIVSRARQCWRQVVTSRNSRAIEKQVQSKKKNQKH